MPAPAFTYDQLQDQYATNGIGAITALCHRRFVSSAIGWRSTVDPTVNNDKVDTAVLGSYFDAGQLWANTLTKHVWLCCDGTPTAAVWKDLTATDINWLGAWNALFSYVPGDAVDSGGSSYLCILANINQMPPNALYWQLLAAGVAGGPAGGDLGGTYPNPAVDQVRGIAVSATPPTTGQVLTATSPTAADWQAPAGGPPSGAAGGDLGGTYPNPAVDQVRGIAVSATPPTTGQVLTATSPTAADWQTPSGGGTEATISQVRAESPSGVFLAPDVQMYQPGYCQAWATVLVPTSLFGPSYNVASITHLGTGQFRITLTVATNASNFAVGATCVINPFVCVVNGWVSSSQFDLYIYNLSGVLSDPVAFTFVCMGGR